MKKKPTQVLQLSKADTANAPLQIRYTGKRETTASGGTITIDNNGDDSSTLLITLVGWADGAASTKYFSGDGYAAGGADDTVVTTLQALIDAINGAGIGFEARRANGLTDLATDTDNFIDIAATQISQDWTNVLYRDASEYNATGWTGRAGVPEINKRGRIEILKLVGTGTYASGILTWNVISDRGSAPADEVSIFSVLGAATTVEATVFDYSTMESPPVVNGPIAIEAIGAAVSAVTATLLYRPLD